jgi:hypothetical protein
MLEPLGRQARAGRATVVTQYDRRDRGARSRTCYDAGTPAAGSAVRLAPQAKRPAMNRLKRCGRGTSDPRTSTAE